MKLIVDEVIEEVGCVENVVVYWWFGDEGDESDVDVLWIEGCDEWWGDIVGVVDFEYEIKCLLLDVELMLLYFLGMIGKLKGIVYIYVGV